MISALFLKIQLPLEQRGHIHSPLSITKLKKLSAQISQKECHMLNQHKSLPLELDVIPNWDVQEWARLEKNKGRPRVFITVSLFDVTNTMVSMGFAGRLGPVPRGLGVSPSLLREMSIQNTEGGYCGRRRTAGETQAIYGLACHIAQSLHCFPPQYIRHFLIP